VSLPAADAAYLDERGLPYQVSVEAGMTCVVLPGWKLPAGYNRATADLLLRLQPGYPDLPPDMWWFEPALLRADGRQIQATEATEPHLGRTWQRWSRHLDPSHWQSGIDGMETYLTLITHELERCAMEPAA
jgi:hypothetical protein